jgi:uncharacterized repeat protein (TIGR03803 family)
MRNCDALLLAILVVLFVLAAPIQASAQAATYTDLHDFNCGSPATGPCYPAIPGILAQGTDGNFYGMACDTYSFCNNGSVFKMTPDGNVTNLYFFDNATAGNPGLTLGPDGNFYGVTAFGGTNNLGTIFSITPEGVLSTLHSFSGSDGQNPAAPPVIGDDGNLYGTALDHAYKINPTGAFSVLSDQIPFAGNTGSMSPLFLASDGSFYGTVPYAGLNVENGVVFRMSPGGAVTILYKFEPDANGTFLQGNFPYGGLVQGSDGQLYGTAGYGGAFADCTVCGVVFQLSTNGTLGWVYSFTAHDDGYLPQAGLIAASDDNLYGATSFTGCDSADCNGTFFKVSESGVFDVVYILTADCSAGSCYGSVPVATPTQATSGIIFGLASQGGSANQGVAYSLNAGLPPFVSTVQPSGKVGQTIGFLGDGFNAASNVSFNGRAATFSVVSDHYLTATVPAGATTGPVSVNGLASNRVFRVQQTTTTKVTTSGSPSSVGQPVTFTATVTAKQGTVPNGELVVFFDGSTRIGSGTTLSGAVVFTTSSLSVKAHTIKGSYEGDGQFATSSGTVTQVVNLYSSTTALTSNVNPSNFGQMVTLTATVTSASPMVPTGTVTFKTGSTSLGKGILDATGTATLTTTKLALGSNALTASYSGDSMNQKGSSPVLTLVVNQAQISLALTSSPNPSRSGQSVKFTATLTSNGGLPSGQFVTFSYNGTTLGSATITTAGKAILSTAALPAGADVTTASYAGDTQYSLASAQTTQKVH